MLLLGGESCFASTDSRASMVSDEAVSIGRVFTLLTSPMGDAVDFFPGLIRGTFAFRTADSRPARTTVQRAVRQIRPRNARNKPRKACATSRATSSNMEDLHARHEGATRAPRGRHEHSGFLQASRSHSKTRGFDSEPGATSLWPHFERAALGCANVTR